MLSKDVHSAIQYLKKINYLWNFIWFFTFLDYKSNMSIRQLAMLNDSEGYCDKSLKADTSSVVTNILIGQ